MTTLQSIKWCSDRRTLKILDQTLLPFETKYVEVKNVEDGWNAIHRMQVRGAPAIAIVGCLSLVVDIYSQPKFKDKETLYQYIVDKLKFLVTARPTAVNMQTAANQMLYLAKYFNKFPHFDLEYMQSRILKRAEDMLMEDLKQNRAIGRIGVSLIKFVSGTEFETDSVTILTHCNTGSLATAGFGTALGVIRALHEKKKIKHVYCTETRPCNQGSRLTAYELMHEKIPATLICDNMVAALFKSRSITAVIVGADRIAANGDTANKIGTYSIAVLAKVHSVPFYVAAPISSIDFNIPNGQHIVIEERDDSEITHMKSERIATEGIKCWNPAFDVTPDIFITNIITEEGVFKPGELHMLQMAKKMNNLIII